MRPLSPARAVVVDAAISHVSEENTVGLVDAADVEYCPVRSRTQAVQ